MTSRPYITVLMSVYNGEQFLRLSIDSILAQTFTNFEFVIYDDCSTDSTSDIIKSYTDERIVYRRNDTNQGLTHNLADGVSRSEAKYIARMDADDIAYPERFAKQVAWMDEHRNISILGTPVTYFRNTLGDGGLAEQPVDDATIKATLFISFTLMHPTIMFRREDLVRHNLNYNPDYRYSQDHALYFDCIRKGLKFANYTDPLLHMRAHENSISRAKHGVQQECSQRARLNFLKATGIGKDCTTEEIEVYNFFASGVYPETPAKVHLFESFVKKVYEDSLLGKYFDKDIVRRLMAEILCDGAYHAIDDKQLKESALTARKSELRKYSATWPFKIEVKFLIKSILK